MIHLLWYCSCHCFLGAEHGTFFHILCTWAILPFPPLCPRLLLPVILPVADSSPRSCPHFLDFYPHMHFSCSLLRICLPHLVLSLQFLHNHISNSCCLQLGFLSYCHTGLFSNMPFTWLDVQIWTGCCHSPTCLRPVVLGQQLDSEEEAGCQIWFLISYLFNP